MPTNEFLPFASGTDPNVMSQADYAASSARMGGVLAGTARSDLANKSWRQGLNMASAWGVVLNGLGFDALDDGDVDALAASLEQALAGRLIGVQVFRTPGTATYTPSVGTTSIVVEVQGGGGGSGGVPSTNSSENGISVPGGAGSYAKSRITAAFSGATITVGAAGSAGASGATTGGAGGTSSFGALVSAPGGNASSTVGKAVGSYPDNTSVSGSATAPSGANIIGSAGARGSQPIMVAQSFGSGFEGGNSIMGKGYGCGADAVYTYSSTAATAGKAGDPGAVIIWEYA